MTDWEYNTPKIINAKEQIVKGRRIIWREEEGGKRKLMICHTDNNDFTHIPMVEECFDSFEDWIKKTQNIL